MNPPHLALRSLSKTKTKIPPKLNTNTPKHTNQTHPILKNLETCKNYPQFKQVQAQLTTLGLFQDTLFAGKAIKKLSSLHRGPSLAVSLLLYIEYPDAFMYNAIIRSYLNQGDPRKGLVFYYEGFVGGNVLPNHFTFPLVVRACGDCGLVWDGEKAHCRVLKCGFGVDLFVRNGLIRMYSCFGRVWDAYKVFGEPPVVDLVSWNLMVDGFVKNGYVGIARELFDEMRERDVVTWNSMLGGYVGVGDMEAAVELFEEMPVRDVVSWNCLLDGCARVGDVGAARECFDRMGFRNVVSWNTMLAVCVRCKEYEECLGLFDRMMEGEIRPNEATLVSVLIACGSLGRLDQGKRVHQYIIDNRRIKPDTLLGTSLLTMYVKCGEMEMAKKVFDRMPEKSVVSWNSMIMGYGTHGCAEKALAMFLEMEKTGQPPNDATFVCVLSACAQGGLVLEGWWYFDIMHRVYKIEPKVEHYGCMVDLFRRSGLLKDTIEQLGKNPKEEGSPSWGALLTACHAHTISQMGEFVGKWLIGKQPDDSGAYLLLASLYAAEGRWLDVDKVRRVMKGKGLNKVVGSSIPCFWGTKEISTAEDGSFHRPNMIYSMLRLIGTRMKQLADRAHKVVYVS